MGVMQGYPISLTIFNMVVYSVVRYWIVVMVESAGERSWRRQEGRPQNYLLYVDDIMVESSDPRWIEGALRNLLEMLDRVEIKTNIRKTPGMVCRLYQTEGTH